MDSLAGRARPTRWILAGLLVGGAYFTADAARGQTAAQEPARSPARDSGAAAQPNPQTGRRDPNPNAAREKAQAQAPATAPAQQPGHEPSEAFRQSLRQTLEKRRQRRARRVLALGAGDPRPIGAIVPWPMPPALIIRHTPAVHGEVESLLGQLRR
jgi:hypothetical protein